MKNINQFTVGENIKVYLMVKQIVRKNKKNGENYFRFELQDKSGVINGNIWTINEETEKIQKNDIVLIDGLVEEYMGQKQLNIRNIEKTDGSLAENFIEKAPVMVKDLQFGIEHAISQISNTIIQRITRTIYEENKNDFLVYPAAVRNHHEFLNGLAYHTYTMIKLAYAIKKIYDEINLDLLVGGIILHDMAKVIELSGPIGTEYTKKGKLIGHISLINSKIESTANQLGLQDEEAVLLLQHMVLSHHGKNEYGSPVLPMILEAEMLHYIDNIDARVNMIKKAIDSTSEHEFTNRVFGLENRAMYNHQLDKEKDIEIVNEEKSPKDE